MTARIDTSDPFIVELVSRIERLEAKPYDRASEAITMNATGVEMVAEDDDWTRATTIATSATIHPFVPHFDLRDRCCAVSAEDKAMCFRFAEDGVHGSTSPATEALTELRDTAIRWHNIGSEVVRVDLCTAANEYARKAGK